MHSVSTAHRERDSLMRTFMPKEVLRWYQHLPAEDQNVITIAIQKQIDARFKIKEAPSGKAVHDNSNK